MSVDINEVLKQRTCSYCNNVLPVKTHEHRPDIQQQYGWYCCDEYWCSERCLKKPFLNSGETWEEHYTDDGDCYYTEWDLSDLINEYEEENKDV